VICYVIRDFFVAETYDINRIIEYPGFNVEAEPGTIDVSNPAVISKCINVVFKKFSGN